MTAISCKEIGHNFQSDGAICVRCGKAMCELIAEEPPRPSTEILCRDAKAHVWLQGRCLVCGLSQSLFTTPPPTPPPPTMPHAHALYEQAEDLICGDRRTAYGEVHQSFTRLAHAMTAVLLHKLKEPITKQEACLLLEALKLCRESNNPKRDNRLDGVNYWGLLEELHQPETKL
jgi:hypothetical protein